MCPKIESLSDTDLLGVLVGPRHAIHLLRDSSGSLSQLLHEPFPVEYAQPRVASKLKAAAELVRRSLVEAIAQKDVLASPAEVRTFLRVTLTKRDHEVFMVLFMDAQNRVIASEEMFRGTLTQTSVYPREVVKRALAHNAAAVILAHNHPELRKTHVGRSLSSEEESVTVFRDDTLAADDRAFFLKVRDVVEAAVSEATFRQVAMKLQKTRGIRLTGDPVKTVEVVANRYTLNDTERAGVLRHLIIEGDLSAYGLVNAVTHYSQDVEDYDRATEFEALGGKLIELNPGEWKELAHAA